MRYTVDDTLAQLSGAKMCFWQVPLEQSSKLLTAFIIPYECYCFNKLPFRICCAPEHFQKQMEKILTRFWGVLCYMDDVLIFGRTKEEHDARLEVP